MGDAKVITAELDPAEMAVGMCEASYQIKRPPGTNAQQALEQMDPECAAGWLRAAKFAAEYLASRINVASANAAQSEILLDRDCAFMDGNCDCPRPEGGSLPQCKKYKQQ